MLTTERLVLRLPERSDLEAFVRLCADPAVMRFIGRGRPLDRASAELAFEVMLAHWDQHGLGLRSALERATGAYLGFVGLAVVPPGGAAPGETEIGWRLRCGAWGRGLATEGARAVRDEARARLDSLVSVAQPANHASRRVMDKLGMGFEREARGRYGEPVVVYRWRAGEAPATGVAPAPAPSRNP